MPWPGETGGGKGIRVNIVAPALFGQRCKFPRAAQTQDKNSAVWSADANEAGRPTGRAGAGGVYSGKPNPVTLPQKRTRAAGSI